MSKLNILIRGMHCTQCVQTIEQALQALPGVETCVVQVGSAEVGHDPAITPKSDIFEAIRRAGTFEIAGFSTSPTPPSIP